MSNRRDFLKDAGVMAGAAAVAGYVPLSESACAAVQAAAGIPATVGAEPVDPSLPPSGVQAGPLPPVPTPKCTPAVLAARGQIAAKVDQRLLTKANRLFGGTSQGRITEMLQNSRRAGATTVWILYDEDKKFVRYFDDGHGLTDFGQLLSLGFSGWNEDVEAAEDPAGAGFFSLAPRQVTAHSRGQKVVITEAGWLGMPIDVVPSDWYGKGIQLEFPDEWTYSAVEDEAEFGPLTVYYNGRKIAKKPFLRPGEPIHDCPELGCRIQLRTHQHPSRGRNHFRDRYVVFNFHGQTLSSHEIKSDVHDCIGYDVIKSDVHDCIGYDVAVELTGAPTELRMVLPAREKLVVNEAALELKRKIERLIFADLVGKSHSLPYAIYTHGRALGFDLSEAQESWNYGVGDWNENCFAELDFPKREDDRERISYNGDAGKCVDLLACFSSEFHYRPAEPRFGNKGYAWADMNLSCEDIEIFPEQFEKRAFNFSFNGMDVDVVKAISVEATIHNKETDQFEVVTCKTDVAHDPQRDKLYVTEHGLHNIADSTLYAICGGHWDEDKSWDQQFDDYMEEYEEAVALLKGPYEAARQKFVEHAHKLVKRVSQDIAKVEDWDTMQYRKDGSVVFLKKGKAVATVAKPKSRA